MNEQEKNDMTIKVLRLLLELRIGKCAEGNEGLYDAMVKAIIYKNEGLENIRGEETNCVDVFLDNIKEKDKNRYAFLRKDFSIALFDHLEEVVETLEYAIRDYNAEHGFFLNPEKYSKCVVYDFYKKREITKSVLEFIKISYYDANDRIKKEK